MKNYNSLQSRIDELEKTSVSILEDIKNARLDGDLSENADWILNNRKYEFIQGQILALKNEIDKKRRIRKAERVKVEYLDVKAGKVFLVEIVDSWQSDPSDGKISLNSPLGIVLDKKIEGEVGEILTKSGSYRIKIIKKYVD